MRILIMKPYPLTKIESTSISEAWRLAMIEVAGRPGGEIIPLVVSVTGLAAEDIPVRDEIRDRLDAHLSKAKHFLTETVASTIFPVSMWNPKLPRQNLFNRYKAALPMIKRAAQNHNGVYFERLTGHFQRVVEGEMKEVNQLDFILDSYDRGNHRHSALQVSVMDPAKDVTNQRQRGFPCLQQISFAPFGRGELAVNGFYGTQWIYQKAYGNYLGLLNLGRFVAHEMGLRLTQMHCFTGIAQIGTTKNRVADLVKTLTR
jgi:hypothetical protein